MVLPKAFKLHEPRLSKETREVIEFQFDRLGLKSTDLKTFLERFLRISTSPTLPPNDHEILYLASKVAYMLSDYNYFESNYFKEKMNANDGARIWYALVLAAKGEVDEGIKILLDAKKNSENSGDILQYIEATGILAQLYFLRGLKDKEKLDKIMTDLNSFKEKNQHSLPDFDHIFMPVYLIQGRMMTQQLPPKELITELNNIYNLTEKIDDYYWMVMIKLDLVSAYLSTNEIKKAEELIEEVFSILGNFAFHALEAKAIRIHGEVFEKQKKYPEAEKYYLKAKDYYSKLNDQIGVSISVSRLAQLAYMKGETDKAETFFTESFILSETMNDFYGMAISLSALAKIASEKSQYAEAFETYKKVLKIVQDNNFEYLFPQLYDGLSFVNFISGDFWNAVEYRSKAVQYKEKMNYPLEELLVEHMKLGQLNSIVGNFDHAFDEFEQALNICMKYGRKDELYFDILIWLFEISTELQKYSLAETYVSRAELFASIHNSAEENVQTKISRIRFLIYKKELMQSEKVLEEVFEVAQDFTSALTMALALIEKAMVHLLIYQTNSNSLYYETAMQTMEDMIFISLDLEFLPLTMYSKRALARSLAYQDKYKDALDEIEEAIDLAEELGMLKFEDIMKEDIQAIKNLQQEKEDSQKDKIDEVNKRIFSEIMSLLKQSFWLVNASELQTLK